MKKYLSALYIGLFVLCICLSNVLYIGVRRWMDTRNYENRKLNDMPVIGECDYMDYSEQFEAYYNDHIPFRNELIELRNRIGYYGFHSTFDERVLAGKQGWLYLSDKNQGNTIDDYTGVTMLTDEELALIADNMKRCREYLDACGIEFVIMINPNKARVYSEYLPEYLGQPAKNYAAGQIVDYIRENTDIRIVYTYDELMNAKELLEGEGKLLYHKADTHWNKLGAFVATNELLTELGVDTVCDINSGMNITPCESLETDLADMLHLSQDFAADEVDYNISGYDAYNVKKVQNDFNNVYEYVSDSPDVRCIYVCRDSFATAMGDYLGANFARTYMRHYDTYSNEDLAGVMPDVFVLETVERTAAYKLMNFDIQK